MRIVVHDLIVRPREVELPAACPRCGTRVTTDGALLLCEHPRQSSLGHVGAQGKLAIRDVSFGPEALRLRTMVSCSGCGKLFGDGEEEWIPKDGPAPVSDGFTALMQAVQEAREHGRQTATVPSTPPTRGTDTGARSEDEALLTEAARERPHWANWLGKLIERGS